MKKRLNQYRGLLNSKKIAEGINAAIEQSSHLLKSAQILFKSEIFPSSTALSILSIEEAGKISILRDLSLAHSDQEAYTIWKRFRSHTSKNFMAGLPELVAKGGRKLEDFRPLFSAETRQPYLVDQIKQICFYVDCLGKMNWSKPCGIIDAQGAAAYLQLATILARDTVVSIEEIDLWIKHMKPVRHLDIEIQKAALISWEREMIDRGLRESHSISMADFVSLGSWITKIEKFE